MPGVNQVSEGQAAVPAVRGLARGRTLDPDRRQPRHLRAARRSERDLHGSVDASTAIDIARGPGSVAYGSDAFGGVISVRTRRPSLSPACRRRASVTFGGGIPDRRVEGSVLEGLRRRRHSRRGPRPRRRRLRRTRRRSAQFRLGRLRVSWFAASVAFASGLFTASWQSDFGRDIERPRNNSNQVRFYYPFENSHRFNASFDRNDVAGFDSLHVSGFPRHDRAAHRPGPHSDGRPARATSSAPTSRPKTSSSASRAKSTSIARSSSSAPTSTAATASKRTTSSFSTTSAGDVVVEHRQSVGRFGATDRHRLLRASGIAARQPPLREGRRPRRPRQQQEHRRLLRRSVDLEWRRGRLRVGERRAVPQHRVHGAGVARLPRPDALRSLLPRPERPWLHHRQSRSRSGDEPAVRLRRPLRDRPGAVCRPTAITTASATSSSASRRKPTSSSSGTAAAHGSAASSSKPRPTPAAASRSRSRRSSAAAKRSTTMRISTTSRRTRSPCSSASRSRRAPCAFVRLAVYARGRSPGSE